jgi:hypothetical protein
MKFYTECLLCLWDGLLRGLDKMNHCLSLLQYTLRIEESSSYTIADT